MDLDVGGNEAERVEERLGDPVTLQTGRYTMFSARTACSGTSRRRASATATQTLKV
jgi:hypothetical protein